MRCPECHSLNEPDSAACVSCGLLLLNAAPKRRAEDFAHQKRRAEDNEHASCRYCGGEIAHDAVRCRHCSEVVDEHYFRERAKLVRSRVNYASWVAYLFGLAALLVFRPVGVLSIGAGLLLSIAYYAIPVEPPPADGSKRRLGRVIARQLKLERVSIPIPRFGGKKLIFVGTPLVAAVIGYSANALLVQQPMNDVLRENDAFRGMEVSAHYEYWVVPGVVVYDLRQLSFRQTPIDVHTAFLEFAKRMRAKRYSRVDLSWRGTAKFSIDGSSFRRLGEEYARHNFDFVLYRFASLFKPAPGTHIPPQGSDRDALVEFHREWYGEDVMTKSVRNGM